jgi:hypothetical protein
MQLTYSQRELSGALKMECIVQMNQQGGPEGNVALVVENLQTLEAARSALANDIAALRQAILKGSQMLTLDLESLATHLTQTHRLLTAAKQACEEIILSLKNS